MMILMIVIAGIVDCKITIKEVQEYAEYYFAIKTILKEKPMNFMEWKEKQNK